VASLTIANRTTALGKSLRVDKTITTDGVVMKDPTLAAAKSGTLTTRTDSDTGTLTMSSGHGITTGAKVSIFWEGGSRYNVTVGTVSTNSVPFDLGAGDNLPVANTAVTVMVSQSEDLVVEYGDLQALLCGCTSPATVEFWSSAPALVAGVQITADADYVWTVDDGTANPFGTTDIVTVKVAHGATAARQVNVLAFVN
jgi:hypothetical protein